MLFHKEPEKWVQGAYIKIGYFGSSDSELIYQDEIHGPLMLQIDETIKTVYQKYLKALIDYEGIQRTETYMFPVEGFREILLNAINHKDYSRGVPIQISIYDDKIYVWNDGRFPDTLTTENIYEKHSSIPFNPKIADTLFKAGMIESWGRGFDKIKEECIKSNTPLPEYEASSRGIMVRCLPSEKYTELAKKYNLISQNGTNNGTKKLIEDNFPESKVQKIMQLITVIEQDSFATRQKLSVQLEISERTISRYLDKLQKLGIIKRDGSKTSGSWIIKKG